MATFTNTSKSSTATFTPVSRNTSVWDIEEKGGTGWEYNEVNYTYNQDTDPVTGFDVLYNGTGTAPTWSTVTKN